MRFKAFRNFSFGKIKDQNKNKKVAEEDSPAPEITEIEGRKTGGPETATQNGEKPAASDVAGIITAADDIPVRPHGPAAELTIDPEDSATGDTFTLDEVESNDSVKLGDEVKIRQVSAEKAAKMKAAAPAAPVAPDPAAAPAEAKQEEKKEDKADDADSLNSLFSEEETEENPLASLINSLPDVTVQELLDDLEEIQRIIKEWRPALK